MDHLLHASINGICCVGYEESEANYLSILKRKRMCVDLSMRNRDILLPPSGDYKVNPALV